jgi:hypothetical protein
LAASSALALAPDLVATPKPIIISPLSIFHALMVQPESFNVELR